MGKLYSHVGICSFKTFCTKITAWPFNDEVGRIVSFYFVIEMMSIDRFQCDIFEISLLFYLKEVWKAFEFVEGYQKI